MKDAWTLLEWMAAYEFARSIFMFGIRSEIARIANTRSTCPRCRWRLFCARSAAFLFTRTPKSLARFAPYILGVGLGIGNMDALWLVLQKLLAERKAVIRNDGRKEKTAVPGPGL